MALLPQSAMALTAPREDVELVTTASFDRRVGTGGGTMLLSSSCAKAQREQQARTRSTAATRAANWRRRMAFLLFVTGAEMEERYPREKGEKEKETMESVFFFFNFFFLLFVSSSHGLDKRDSCFLLLFPPQRERRGLDLQGFPFESPRTRRKLYYNFITSDPLFRSLSLFSFLSWTTGRSSSRSGRPGRSRPRRSARSRGASRARRCRPGSSPRPRRLLGFLFLSEKSDDDDGEKKSGREKE